MARFNNDAGEGFIPMRSYSPPVSRRTPVGSLFRLRVSHHLGHATFPAPASSNAACGFLALRSPVCFAPRIMGPILPERLSALVVPLGSHRTASEFGTAIPYSTASSRSPFGSGIGPQNFQDVSAFALTYILRLRSCKSMDAFVISSLPSLWSETLQTAGLLRSTGVPPLRRYFEPIRHPLAFDRLPG